MLRSMARYLLPGVVKGSLRRAVRVASVRRTRAALESRAESLGSRPKIVYALTPPATLTNVGDQAQAVAIHRWLAKHYANWPVLEVDKDEVLQCRDVLKRIVNPDNLMFLHSGGNLGDRGIWSETGRRQLIADF